MNDQNIPADPVRKIADAMDASMRRCDEYPLGEFLGSAVREHIRALRALLPAPPRPTLADMTEEERAACQWMQADIIVGHDPLVITHIERSDGTATILDRNGRYDEVPAEEVTPRPDLPRFEWPGDTPAPALPEGWRLADHAHFGRVITSPRPDDEGFFTIFARSAASRDGVAQGRATAEVLKFLDGPTPLRHHPGDTPTTAPALPDGWRLADHPEYGRVVVTNPAPDAYGNVCFVTPAPDPIGNDWRFCDPDRLTYLDQ